MKFEIKKNFPILIVIISLFCLYSISGHPLYIFGITVGLSYILINLFGANEYNNKLFYIVFLSIIALQGLILTHIYLFKVIYSQYAGFYILFGLAIGIFIFHILYFLYYYPNKPGDIKIHIN